MISEASTLVPEPSTISTGNSINPSSTGGPPTTSGPSNRSNEVRTVMLYGVPIVALVMEGEERLCLAQISNTLLKQFSYNEIHNRRVALGIRCIQCTPVQLELLRRAGAMPVSSRRCGMITKREAERLCKSFLAETSPPKLPENFAFDVYHQCSWGSKGSFMPSRYNSSRAKCIKCLYCNLFFSPNKFIFHSHRLPDSKYVQPDAANFNSWRRHIKLYGNNPEEVLYAWEDVKAMFNGGSRKRNMIKCINSFSKNESKEREQAQGSKRQKRDSPSPEIPSHSLSSTTGFTEPRPPVSPNMPQSSYYPIVPFPNKAYSLSNNLNPNPSLPQTYTKLFPTGPQPDFRQNFAEFMWPGKRPGIDLPYNGLLWHRPLMDASVGRIAHELCYNNNNNSNNNGSGGGTTGKGEKMVVGCLSKEAPPKEDLYNGKSSSPAESNVAKDGGGFRHFSAFKPVNKYPTSGHMIHEIVASSVVATPSSESDNNEAGEEDNVDVDVIGTEEDEEDNNNCTILETSGAPPSKDDLKHISSVAKDLNQIPDRNSISERTNTNTNLETLGPHGSLFEPGGKCSTKGVPGKGGEALDLRNVATFSKVDLEKEPESKQILDKFLTMPHLKHAPRAYGFTQDCYEEPGRSELVFREEIERQLKLMYYAKNCMKNTGPGFLFGGN